MYLVREDRDSRDYLPSNLKGFFNISNVSFSIISFLLDLSLDISLIRISSILLYFLFRISKMILFLSLL